MPFAPAGIVRSFNNSTFIGISSTRDMLLILTTAEAFISVAGTKPYTFTSLPERNISDVISSQTTGNEPDVPSS